MKFDKMISQSGVNTTEELNYVDEEGTLLVSEEELTTQLQNSFNASGASQYTCVNQSV